MQKLINVAIINQFTKVIQVQEKELQILLNLYLLFHHIIVDQAPQLK